MHRNHKAPDKKPLQAQQLPDDSSATRPQASGSPEAKETFKSFGRHYFGIAELPGENPADFKKLLASLIEESHPRGEIQHALVHDVARIVFRLRYRDTYAKVARAYREFGACFEGQTDDGGLAKAKLHQMALNHKETRRTLTTVKAHLAMHSGTRQRSKKSGNDLKKTLKEFADLQADASKLLNISSEELGQMSEAQFREWESSIELARCSSAITPGHFLEEEKFVTELYRSLENKIALLEKLQRKDGARYKYRRPKSFS